MVQIFMPVNVWILLVFHIHMYLWLNTYDMWIANTYICLALQEGRHTYMQTASRWQKKLTLDILQLHFVNLLLGARHDIGFAIFPAAFWILFGCYSCIVVYDFVYWLINYFCSLWGGSVINLGTKKHRDKYYDGIDNLDYPGCFAMTELHHGKRFIYFLLLSLSFASYHLPLSVYAIKTGKFVWHPHLLILFVRAFICCQI